MSTNPQYNFIYTVASNDLSDIVYTDPASLQGVNEFVELIDGPGDYGNTGQFLQSNGAGLQWVNGTGSLTDFIQLNDCPNNYGSFSGQSLITDGVSNITYGPLVPEFVQQLGNVDSFTIADSDKLVVVDNTGSSYTYTDLPSKVKNEVVFSDLLDVANPYSIADANKAVVVNATGDGLEYSALTIPTTFTGLTDCPASYVGANNYKVKVNGTATGLEFVVDSGGGGVDKFTDLNDVLLSYPQNTYKVPQVNYLQNALTISPNGFTELTTTNFSSSKPNCETKLWYSKTLVHRPKLFFSYSYNANTISPNNNRGYTNELVVNIPSGSYAPHIVVGKNNARCSGNSPYTDTEISPINLVFSFNEDSGILTFTNPNVTNGLETHPLIPISAGLLIFKATLSIGIQQSQTPNKDTMVIFGLGKGSNSSGNPSILYNTCCCVMNGSSNNSKPTAGMQGTASKTFHIYVAPNQTNQYFNVDLSFSSLNNSQNLIASADIVYYSWTLEEL